MSSLFPVFLDCEASSLADNSYPIEIAWSDVHGNIESHLINPEVIATWTDWNDKSELIHGLSRQYIKEHGEDPFQVAERMQNTLAGAVVYSDNPEWDEMWCKELFKAVDLTMPFEFGDSVNLFLSLLPGSGHNNKKKFERYKRLESTALKRVGGRHRAEIDVQFLIEFFKMVKAESK